MLAYLTYIINLMIDLFFSQEKFNDNGLLYSKAKWSITPTVCYWENLCRNYSFYL